ncbi:MAG TPA: N-acetylmuramoyl-L-alanine amidase [Verrucomicrobiae bacterium]|nr:N-acetylmuramoyl-L-alanine amidase [Verrucomicrobiae bacterium]
MTYADDWSALGRHQQTISRPGFDALLARVYCPSGALTNYLAYGTNSVTVFSTPEKTNALFTLRFSSSASSPGKGPPSIKRVALDPGHIGGEWARMEERFFQRGKDRPVQEAVLNLTAARLLKARLEARGVEVLLTKNSFDPVTDKRPADFQAQAEQDIPLTKFAALPPLDRDADRADAVRKRAEQLFYRGSEIAARARLINEQIKPDLTICMHFNAVEWDECQSLVDDDRLVVFVHGDYLAAELKDDDQKLRLFSKLLEGSHATEQTVAESIAAAMAVATKLPPVEYGPSSGAIRLGDSPYVFARNLAANRLYNGPVVFLEPYYMNNRLVYERIQLGDYDGTRDVDGVPMKSIFREYADAVAEGLSRFIAR